MAKKPSGGKRKGAKSAKAGDAGVLPEVVEEAAPAEETVVEVAPVAEPVEPEVEEPEEFDDTDDAEEPPEEQGSPLSRKLLTGLLLLIAGAGIGLWGAPKVAARLPAGLSLIADWLTPGVGNAQEELAALRAEFEDRLAALPEPVDEARIGEIVSAQVVPVTSRLIEKVGVLSDRAAAGDMGDVEARLVSAETRLEGLASEVGSLSEQLSSFTVGNGEMTAETAAQVAGYRATVEGLKAAIDALSSRQGEIAFRIEAVDAATTRKAEEARVVLKAAETEAALKSGLAALREALSAGVPFGAALAEVSAAAGQPVPEALASAADAGVPTLQSLLDSFPVAAYAAIRASIGASAGDGAISRLGAFVESRVASRSLTPREGVSPDAILSRMEAALKEDDLVVVLGEADGLPSEARAQMTGWLGETERRYAATDALARLTAALALAQ